MKFFLDTADLAEIEEVASWGALAGVTTNPSLYARTGGKLEDFEGHLVKICKLVDGPVSGEVTAEDRDGMIEQGRALAALADNMVVKIPVGRRGTRRHQGAFRGGHRREHDARVHRAPGAARGTRGARYISPFVGRFDDIAEDGLDQLDDIVTAIQNYDFGHPVEIIAASIRSANHVTQAALMGADIATVPYGAMKKCIYHPLTEQGLEKFKADWEKVENA